MPRNPYKEKVTAVATTQSKDGYVIKIKRTRAEQVELGLRICTLYSTGRYSLTEICKSLNVTMVNFNRWAAPKINAVELSIKQVPLPKGCLPEVNEAYRKAKITYQEIYLHNLKDRAQQGLIKKIEGTEWEEVNEQQEIDNRETINGEPNPNFGQMMTVKRTVKTGKNAPDTAAIIFALTNVDSDNFKNTGKMVQTNVQLNNNLGELSTLSDEDLTVKLQELQGKVHRLKEAKAIAAPAAESQENFEDLLENDR